MGFLIHGIFNTWSWWSCKTSFFGPSRTVKLYFSVPVELYTVFLGPKTLVKTLVKNLAKNPVKNLVNIWPKSGHADHVIKTQVYTLTLK